MNKITEDNFRIVDPKVMTNTKGAPILPLSSYGVFLKCLNKLPCIKCKPKCSWKENRKLDQVHGPIHIRHFWNNCEIIVKIFH